MGKQTNKDMEFPSLNGKKRRFALFMACPENAKLERRYILNEFGISKDTYYKWLKDTDVLGLMQSEIDKYAKSFLPDAWHDLKAACDDGNVQAIKFFFEMVGMKEPEKNETVINVTIRGDDADEE